MAGGQPQSLALLASAMPVPLQCENGSCVADLPTMCLEPERPTPEMGFVYEVATAGQVTVIGRDETGRRLVLPLPADADITALRSHVAVRLQLEEGWLRQSFARVDGLMVTAEAVLAPAGQESEVENLPRQLAARTIVGDAERATAVSVATYILNGLGNDDTPVAVERLWQRATAAMATASDTAASLELATFQRDFCLFGAAVREDGSFRQCLEAQRDRAMEAYFARYSAALAGGS
jgi:hypothetical protein